MGAITSIRASTFTPTLNGGVNHGRVLYFFASIGRDGK
jgi:hypothetical protein